MSVEIQDVKTKTFKKLLRNSEYSNAMILRNFQYRLILLVSCEKLRVFSYSFALTFLAIAFMQHFLVHLCSSTRVLHVNVLLKWNQFYTTFTLTQLNQIYLNQVKFQPIKCIRFVGLSNRKAPFDNLV